ncbi:MAG: hypothetical protein KIC37_07705 [Coriobacteriaceae bacterium]|nr:hypothetical protein [Coriobacteriaceae bacterium]
MASISDNIPRRELSANDFVDAEDLFEQARAAAIDADSIAKRLASLIALEGIKGQSYESHGRSGHRSDAMRNTDRRIAFEEQIRTRQAWDYALIDLASEVIYGSNITGSGGIAAILGPQYADAAWWRFCAAGTWAEVAEGSGMSEKWCRDNLHAVIDTVDAYGIRRVIDGIGLVGC